LRRYSQGLVTVSGNLISGSGTGVGEVRLKVSFLAGASHLNLDRFCHSIH